MHLAHPRRVLTVLLVVVLLWTIGPPASHADDVAGRSAAAEADLYNRINALRGANGVGSLARHPQLDAAARDWAGHLAATGVLAHDPDPAADLAGLPWNAFAENVSVGGSLELAWNGLVASPPHHAVMLNASYTHVGVGVVVDGLGRAWVVHRYARLTGATPPPPPPPPAPPPPPPVTAPPVVVASPPVVTAPVAPPPTAPPVTAPPTTAPPPPPPPEPSVSADPSADPARVSAVIQALRHV